VWLADVSSVIEGRRVNQAGRIPSIRTCGSPGTPVLPSAGTSNAWLGALGIVMTVVYAVSIIIRTKRRHAGFGLDSILNMLLYVLGVIGLLQIAT
jgi:LPXTG-motif cell wall-anchored protein